MAHQLISVGACGTAAGMDWPPSVPSLGSDERYVSHTPNPLSFKILADVDFIRLFTLYLLSMETIKVPRYVKTG